MKLSSHHKAPGEEERRIESGDITWGPASAPLATFAGEGSHPVPQQLGCNGGGMESSGRLLPFPQPGTVSMRHDTISKASHSWQPRAGNWITATHLWGPLQCPASFRGHCQGKSLLGLSDVELSDLVKASPLSFCPSDNCTGQAHPCKDSPCISTSNQTISHNHSSSAASQYSPAEHGRQGLLPPHTPTKSSQ